MDGSKYSKKKGLKKKDSPMSTQQREPRSCMRVGFILEGNFVGGMMGMF